MKVNTCFSVAIVGMLATSVLALPSTLHRRQMNDVQNQGNYQDPGMAQQDQQFQNQGNYQDPNMDQQGQPPVQQDSGSGFASFLHSAADKVDNFSNGLSNFGQHIGNDVKGLWSSNDGNAPQPNGQ